MRRSELEHVIRAASAITNEYEIVVVGSQSILGAVPEPSAIFVASMVAGGGQREGLAICRGNAGQQNYCVIGAVAAHW